jgi:protein-tyrosine phosphatase
MLDLHCHILPSLDDGPASLDEALQMARYCVADGITHIIATPHCHRFVHLLRADILPHVAQMNRHLDAARIPLTILPGSEIQVTDTNEYRREFEAGLFCHLGDGQTFTLLEFSWRREQYPSDTPLLINWICDQGMTPILAHPERHDYFSRETTLLQELTAAGAWVQVTVDSLLGNHGPAPKVAGENILRMYTNAVLATDAHNMGRCSGLSAGYSWVEKELGQHRSYDLQIRASEVLTRTGFC